MATETVVDVTARVAETKAISRLFTKFDDRGMDAYEKVAPILLDMLDQSAESWQASLIYAVEALIELDSETGTWFNATEQREVQAQIALFAVKYLRPLN